MGVFILAKNRLAEIRSLELELCQILGVKGNAPGDAIYDTIYPPTREGFNEFLQSIGIDVDWKGKLDDKEDKNEESPELDSKQ
jgi:hypothetical protein